MALKIHQVGDGPISEWSRTCKAITRMLRRFVPSLYPLASFNPMRAAVVFISLLLGHSAYAQQLVLTPTGNPSVVGSGVGKRAIWFNSGTVGGTPVDIVGKLTSTSLDHIFATGNGQIQITSINQDPHFIEFNIFQAGTYDIDSDSGATVR